MREGQPWRALAYSTLVVGDLVAVAVLSGAALVASFLVGGAVGGYVAAVNREQKPVRPSRGQLATGGRTVAVAAFGCVAGIGLLTQFGILGFLLLLAVAACSPMALARLALLATHIRRDKENDEQAAPAPGAVHVVALRPEPSGLTDADLCRNWTITYGELGRADSAEGRADVVAARTSMLTELERRDPAGFSRWIASGARAASNPQPFLSSRAARKRDPPAA